MRNRAIWSISVRPTRLVWAVRIVAAAAIIATLGGCERVFTYSPFESLQRNPANMSADQQVTFAQDALSSGDPEAMADAFALLSTSEDPETQLVAVDLALGAAEVETVLTGLLSSGIEESEDPVAALEEILAGFTEEDVALLGSAADLLDSSVSGGSEPTAEQYAFVAVGLIVVAASEAGGVEELGSVEEGSDAALAVEAATTYLQQAATLLEESGESADILSGFEGFL